MLCSSCRRQVSRDASGVRAAARSGRGHRRPARARARRRDARPARRRARRSAARPAARCSSPTRACRASTRGSSPATAQGALLEDAGSSHGTFLDGAPRDRRRAAARRREDPRSATRSSRSSAGATPPRPGGRSSSSRARASSCPRPAARPPWRRRPRSSGMRPRVRSGYALKRLDAEEGARRWVLRDLHDGRFLRLSRRRRAAVRAARRPAHAARADRRAPSSASGRPARRGSRGCWPTSASAGSWPASTGATPRRPTRRRASGSGWSRRSEKVWTGVGDGLRPRSTARGGWVLFTRPALWLIGAARGVGHRRLRLPGRRPLRDAVRRRAARSASAASCSWPGASRSWPCTRPRTG